MVQARFGGAKLASVDASQGTDDTLFVGLAVAGLAQDARVLARSGQLYGSCELGREYRFTDALGRRPDWRGRQ